MPTEWPIKKKGGQKHYAYMHALTCNEALVNQKPVLLLFLEIRFGIAQP